MKLPGLQKLTSKESWRSAGYTRMAKILGLVLLTGCSPSMSQDPWIFRVDVELDPGHPPRIRPANGGRAEIPDWEWLAAVDPSRYPTPPGRKPNRIG
jgi:hypothetical protein